MSSEAEPPQLSFTSQGSVGAAMISRRKTPTSARTDLAVGTAASVVASFVTEKQFSQAVVQLAGYCGWKVYRTWLPIHSPAGFPDLILVRGPEMLCIELKRNGRKPTPAQEDWLNALQHVETVNAFCWKPEHWSLIEAALGRESGEAKAMIEQALGGKE